MEKEEEEGEGNDGRNKIQDKMQTSSAFHVTSSTMLGSLAVNTTLQNASKLQSNGKTLSRSE